MIFTRQFSYNTRSCDDLTRPKVNHVFATRCISHNILNEINQLPNEIRDKFLTHTFSGFVLYTPIYFIKMYQPQCVIKNFYVCNRLYSKIYLLYFVT